MGKHREKKFLTQTCRKVKEELVRSNAMSMGNWDGDDSKGTANLSMNERLASRELNSNNLKNEQMKYIAQVVEAVVCLEQKVNHLEKQNMKLKKRLKKQEKETRRMLDEHDREIYHQLNELGKKYTKCQSLIVHFSRYAFGDADIDDFKDVERAMKRSKKRLKSVNNINLIERRDNV